MREKAPIRSLELLGFFLSCLNVWFSERVVWAC